MKKLEAIQYLINAPKSNLNEWVEAGLWTAVKTIMDWDDSQQFKKGYLDSLITDAEKN